MLVERYFGTVHMKKQECIPVGCVLPAHWSYLRISSYPTHAPQSNHACPPEQPCIPPGATMHAPQSNCACPLGATTHAPQGATMHAPHPPGSNHACPSEHPCMPHPPEQPRMPPQEQPCMAPQGATTHAPRSNHAPSRSNHAHPPKQPCTALQEQLCPPTPLEQPCMPPPCGQNVDTRFWKYYLAPTSLRAVISQSVARTFTKGSIKRRHKVTRLKNIGPSMSRIKSLSNWSDSSNWTERIIMVRLPWIIGNYVHVQLGVYNSFH